MVNPCLILGKNSLDKIAGISFIARQEIPRNIEPSPFLITSQHSSTHLAKTFDISKMSVRIDCTTQKLMPTSLAMLHRSCLLSHITRVCTTLTFSSAMGVDRPSIILNALFPPLKLCCPFLSLCHEETPSQGFPWIFMYFL